MASHLSSFLPLQYVKQRNEVFRFSNNYFKNKKNLSFVFTSFGYLSPFNLATITAFMGG